MTSDSLVQIEQKDLPILKELYAPDGIKNYIAFTTIDNYIRWFEQDPNIKHVNFFCLNGDFSDGTFVVTVSRIVLFLTKPQLNHCAEY